MIDWNSWILKFEIREFENQNNKDKLNNNNKIIKT